MTARVLTAGNRVTVRLVKPAKGDIEYPVDVIGDDGNHLVVRGAWAEPDARDVGFVRFEPGDTFTEHYWRDRWYSVKAIHDQRARLKGWYCDVTRPARVERGGVVVSEDLDLDLWVSADRQTILRLDEDDFAASRLVETDPDAAARAVDALDELEALARDAFRGLVPLASG